MARRPEVSILEIVLSILVATVVIVLSWLLWYYMTHHSRNKTTSE